MGKQMDRKTFMRELSADGVTELVSVTRETGALGTHVHPFEAKALVLDGELTIEVDGVSSRYGVGDVFHLPANCAHAERYGPQGVTYLVGRK